MNIQKQLKSEDPSFLLDLRDQYGNAFWLDSYFFAFDPQYVNEVYVKQYPNFIKAGGWHKIRKGLGNGLLVNEEPEHLVHRRILNPAFHIKKIESHLYKMHKIINEEISALSQKDSFDLSTYFFDLSYKILTNTIFDDEELSKSKKLQDVFYSVMKKVGNGEENEPGSLDEDREYLYDFISRVIKKRLDNDESHEDFLDLLIEASVSNNLSLKDITDEVLSMMLAGHETTANTVIWAISNSYNNQSIVKKIKDESDIFVNKINKENILNICKELNYSKNVISESLRLYPPVWFSPRQTLEDCVIVNTKIPKDTKIIISSYVSHRDPNYFEDPNTFIPERWDGGLEESLPSGVYFPFHIGPRTCIGYRFGFLQAQITILEFFNKIKVDLVDGFPKTLILATLRPQSKIIANIIK